MMECETCGQWWHQDCAMANFEYDAAGGAGPAAAWEKQKLRELKKNFVCTKLTDADTEKRVECAAYAPAKRGRKA